MISDPWTNPDPQPGDFDAYLATVDPADVEIHEGDSGTELRVLIGVRRKDAASLKRIAAERGQRVDEVVTDLLRDNDAA
jgi:hypothetical protein